MLSILALYGLYALGLSVLLGSVVSLIINRAEDRSGLIPIKSRRSAGVRSRGDL